MELRNLNDLAAQLQTQFAQGFVADDVELPEYFKQNVKGYGDYKFSYRKYMVHLKSSALDGYIPNAWFFIASFFVDYYNEVQKYKELLIKTLKDCGITDKGKRDEILSRYPKLVDIKYKALNKSEKNQEGYSKCQEDASREMESDIDKVLSHANLSENNKKLLEKFVSDYRWWYGGKTIDRGDFYVSPILTLSNVVNASHSYIAELCKFLAEETKIAAMLRHPKAIIVETSLPAFFVSVFKHLYHNEDKLNAIFEHVVPGQKGSVRYAYDYDGLRQTNFFIKGEDNFLSARKGDFNEYPFVYNGVKFYLSQELAKQRTNKNEVSFYGLKDVIESLYKNYKVLEESDTYIFESNGMKLNGPLQQIHYGAPGTGKSHTINELTEGESVIRTTFHPDSDYSTFVGAYKPTMKEMTMRDLSGHPVVENGETLTEEKIVYGFVEQAFLQAYVKAWKNYVFHEGKKLYLVIEEINRGNCAQIFGDLFQLLDRNGYGFSDYPINADKDMHKFLKKAFARIDEPDKQIFLQEEDKQRINQMYNGNEDVVGKVFAGEILLLPNNLYIWATMNTSDQSLFPIDSAFKRRWDWVYKPIKYDNKDWKVVLADGSWCQWTDLQQTLNDLIYDATESEDKMLGDWFVRAENNVISEEVLVGKIIFYLWNDVAKVDAGKLFDLEVEKNGRKSRKVIFSDFYEVSGKINSEVVKNWLKNIEVTVTEKKTAVADADGSSETPTDE